MTRPSTASTARRSLANARSARLADSRSAHCPGPDPNAARRLATEAGAGSALPPVDGVAILGESVQRVGHQFDLCGAPLPSRTSTTRERHGGTGGWFRRRHTRPHRRHGSGPRRPRRARPVPPAEPRDTRPPAPVRLAVPLWCPLAGRYPTLFTGWVRMVTRYRGQMGPSPGSSPCPTAPRRWRRGRR